MKKTSVRRTRDFRQERRTDASFVEVTVPSGLKDVGELTEADQSLIDQYERRLASQAIWEEWMAERNLRYPNPNKPPKD